MLVTFTSNAPHADVTMFGTAATTLLKMMGQSGNIPGAIMPEDIAAALEHLNHALASQESDEGLRPADELDGAADAAPADGSADTSSSNAFDDEPEQKPVALSQRAAPLIALLEAAQAADSSVLWNE